MKVANFFRYSGSLTTPGCDEIVEWTVADSPVIGLSENQLLEFQKLFDSNGLPILYNDRPVQDLYDRVVRRSFHPSHKRLHTLETESINNAQGLKLMSPVFLLCFFVELNSILQM